MIELYSDCLKPNQTNKENSLLSVENSANKIPEKVRLMMYLFRELQK